MSPELRTDIELVRTKMHHLVMLLEFQYSQTSAFKELLIQNADEGKGVCSMIQYLGEKVS